VANTAHLHSLTAMEIRTKSDVDYKAPPMSRQVSLGLFELNGPGGLRAAKSQIGALIGSYARRSEYQLHWVDPHHLCKRRTHYSCSLTKPHN